MITDLSPQNSLKSIISVFSTQLLNCVSFISRYKIVDICGIGSNGMVYTVIDTNNNKKYALKLINLSYYLADTYHLDRINMHQSAYGKYKFIKDHIQNTQYSITVKEHTIPHCYSKIDERNSYNREFVSLSILPRKKGVLHLCDYGIVDLSVISKGNTIDTKTIPYIVVPLFQGVTLTELVEREMSEYRRWQLAFEITEKVVNVLEIVHQHKIIHRDLYSNNFLFNEENKELYLIDFGSALIQGKELFETPGERRGARRFMSPEQFANPSDVDMRSDYFFVGGLLFYMLTRNTPFSRDRTANTLPLVPSQCIKKPFFIDDDLYLKIIIFLSRLLSFKPEDRYQTIEQIKAELSVINKEIRTVICA